MSMRDLTAHHLVDATPYGPRHAAAEPEATPFALHPSAGHTIRAGDLTRPDPDPEWDEYDAEVAVGTAMSCFPTADRFPADTTRRTGEAMATMARLTLPDDAGPVDWLEFGTVIPVLSGSPGAGASVVAAALSDALQLAGRCTLLVDAADPARSGLAGAAPVPGRRAGTAHPDLAVRYSWRDEALVAQLVSRLPVVTPGMVPPPQVWLPELNPLHATVVDIGHDGWRSATRPLVGAGGWLRVGRPTTRPVLVVRATRPSLAHAERLVARLDPWIDTGLAAAPAAMVVVGARRWPHDVPWAGGERLAELVADAVFLPYDAEVHESGVDADLLPERLLAAVRPLLADWELLPPRRKPHGRRRIGRGLLRRTAR